MKEKSTPIISKFLSFLSVFNLIVMGMCVLFILSVNGTIDYQGFLAATLVGPLAGIVFNKLVETIGSVMWVFIVVNIFISLAMLVAALVIHKLKKPARSVIQNTSRVLQT